MIANFVDPGSFPLPSPPVACKEAALRSAQGVILRQVDRFRNKPDAGDQPRSSGWAILVLCSVYDMTGEKK